MGNALKIGELALLGGVSPDTVRFYERLGLLCTPRRTAARHRIYDQTTVARLRLIRGIQRLGLTLEDIGVLLRLRDIPGPEAAQRISQRLRDRAAAIDQELGKLNAFRELLAKAIERCDKSPAAAFSALERLSDPAGA